MDLEQEINALKSTVQLQAVLIQQLTEELNKESTTRQQLFTEAAPVGIIAAFGGINPPVGWLMCDGQLLSNEQYPDLATAIGRNWGGNQEQTLFNVPDLRGMFLRGVDQDGVRDAEHNHRQALKPGGNSGSQVGSQQGDLLGSHNHGVRDPGHVHGYNWLTHTGGPDIAGGSHCARFNDNGFQTTLNTTGISIDASGGLETRPINAYVHFIIKADSPVS